MGNEDPNESAKTALTGMDKDQAIVGLAIPDVANAVDPATQAELDAHLTAILAKAQHGYPVTWASIPNVAAGNPVTVTGIAVGDIIISIVKFTIGAAGTFDAAASVAVTDGTVGADAVTFTATSFDATDVLLLQYLDRT